MTGDLITQARDDVLSAMGAASSQVRLASPFMGPGILRQLAEMAQDSAAEWRVLTKLDAAAVAHGSLSLQGLRALMRADVSVRSLSNLHAKVFLADSSFGLIGSANLTDAGLGHSHQRSNAELGVLLDAAQRAGAAEQFDTWWNASSTVSEALLDEVEEAARDLSSVVPRVFPGSLPEVSSILDVADELLAEARTSQLWAKAVYQDVEAADEDWGPNPWFSSSKKGKPGFRPGDLVLIYAKHAQVCNAVVEVTSEPRFDPNHIKDDGRTSEEADRWPWVNDIKVRLQVPAARGIPLAQLGFTGLSLQGGHKRLEANEFALAIKHLAQVTV